MQKVSYMLILRLAFQSLGVVFGDLGTSPLYVFYNTFPHGVDDKEDVIGALSMIIYTLTMIPLLKYVFIVLRANDNGQGKQFVLNPYFKYLCVVQLFPFILFQIEQLGCTKSMLLVSLNRDMQTLSFCFQ